MSAGSVPEREALALADVSKTFPGTVALDDVSFSVGRGQVHALVGANGSGKSTLVKVLAGLHRADGGGHITVSGREVSARRTSPEWARASGLRFVHQDPGVFPDLTVAENLAIGTGFPTRWLRTVDWPRLHQRASATLDRFGIEVEPSAVVEELQPADRVLLAIARAFHDDDHALRVLVLDEPTAALPRDRSENVWSALRQAAADGHAILFVSHRLDEVVAEADAVTVLRDGAVVGSVARAESSEAGLAEMMTGRALAPSAVPERRTGHSERAVALAVEDLRGTRVRGATFAVHEGEVLGIAGPLGAGRSELLEIVFGARRARSGAVVLAGRPARFRDIGDAMHAGIAYVPADRGVAAFRELTLSENLEAASLASWWNGLRIRRDREIDDTRVWMRSFSIRAGSPHQLMATLSGGNQQKVLLARWLRRRPAVLLLDGPTRGVDVAARADIYASIARAAADGCAIVVVSDDFAELATISDRVVVMVAGVVVEELRATDITAARLAERALGSSAA